MADEMESWVRAASASRETVEAELSPKPKLEVELNHDVLENFRNTGTPTRV